MSLKDAKILSVEPANDGSYVRLADGRVLGDVNMVANDDMIEAIRQGYICIRCHEPQSEPFPKICESKLPNGVRWCNFPMADLQLSEFAKLYDSEEVVVGSKINYHDEMERLQELDKFERHGPGILIPRGVAK